MSTFPLSVRIYLKKAFLDKVQFELECSDIKASNCQDRTWRDIEDKRADISIQWKVQAAFARAIRFYEKSLQGKPYKECDFDIGYGRDFAEELVKGISNTGSEIIPGWELQIIDPDTQTTSNIARVSQEVALEYLKQFRDEAFNMLSYNFLVVPAQLTKDI